MTFAELDAILKRPDGYSAFVVCNNGVKKFSPDDLPKISEHFGLAGSERLVLSGVRNALSSDYIMHVLNRTYDGIIDPLKEVERFDGKLITYDFSMDFPGDVKETTIFTIEEFGYDYPTFENRHKDYFVYGPAYCYKTKHGLKIFFEKAIYCGYHKECEYEDEETEEFELCDFVITDEKNHVIDYLEAEFDNTRLVKEKGFDKISGLYNWVFEKNSETPYNDFWEIRTEI